jgi:hypothetical protein
MTRFLYGDLLWKTIATRSKHANRTKAAIAYVTTLSTLSLKAGDLLIVDATDGAIGSGQTSARVLGTLFKEGVQIFSHSGLHAKVVIADAVLFASSANLSTSSVTRLLEAGIETDNPNTVSAAMGMIEKLVETSVRIDSEFIARIKKIEVKKHFGGAKSKAKATAKGHRDPVTWLLGIHSVDEPKNPAELSRIEHGAAKAEKFISNPRSSTSWIRYGRTGRMKEARRGDNIVMIYRESEASPPQRVYRHAPVLLVQEEPNCTRVFYEELPNAEKKSLAWSQFKKLAKRVGLPDGISKNTVRQLSEKVSGDLNDHWEKIRGAQSL